MTARPAWQVMALRLAAVPAALFLAGAVVSLRLHLASHLGPLWADVAQQGVEVAAWFAGFVVPAAVLASIAARRWPGFAGRRVLLAVMTYALALVLLLLFFAASDPSVSQDVSQDRLAHAYLAVGALAFGLSTPARPFRAIPAAGGRPVSEA